jgi:hypothetical protein
MENEPGGLIRQTREKEGGEGSGGRGNKNKKILN